MIPSERVCGAGITLRDDGVLIIERVKKDDEGLYECQASNDKGSVKTSAVVTVVGELLTIFFSTPQQHTKTHTHTYTHRCQIIRL